MVELDLLLRFAVVAEELSFTKAAIRLHVDQPWLSRQIQRLETQLGFPLLLRSTRSVTLTSEGIVLLAQVRDLAEVADRTRSTIREMIRSYNALITLGVNPTTYWIPERHRLIKRFEARYGDNSVELVSNYKPRLLSKLRKHLLDVAVIPEPFDFHDLEALVIHRSHPTLLVPADHPLASQGVVKMSDLAGKRIATTNPNLGADFHQRKFGPFFEAGAIPVVIPEGDSAITYAASLQKLILVVLSWPECDLIPPPDFVHVRLSPPAPVVQFAIVRRREAPRSLLNKFWEMARELSDDVMRGAQPALSE